MVVVRALISGISAVFAMIKPRLEFIRWVLIGLVA